MRLLSRASLHRNRFDFNRSVWWLVLLLIGCSSGSSADAQGIRIQVSKTGIAGGESLEISALGGNGRFDFVFIPGETVRGVFGELRQTQPNRATYTAAAYTNPYRVTLRAMQTDNRNRFADLEIAVNPAPDSPGGILTHGSETSLGEVDLRSGAVRSLGNFGKNATERNGTYFYVGSGQSDPGPVIFKRDAQAGQRPWLERSALEFATEPLQPRISPGGQVVSFEQLTTNPLNGESGYFVFVYPSSERPRLAEDVVRILPDFQRAAWLPVSPDAPGGRLVLMAYGDRPEGIYVTDGQLRNPTRLAWDNGRFGTPQQAEPSPDGRRLAVVTSTGDLFVADLQGTSLSNVRRVRTAGNGMAASRPVWSPDGQWLAYFFDVEKSTREVVVSRADRESPPLKVLTRSGDLLLPFFGFARFQLSWRAR